MIRTLLLIWLFSVFFRTYGFIKAGTTPSVIKGCASLVVDFKDKSASTYTINSWAYNFGDGGTSSVQDPKYIYSKAGTFRVILKVTDIYGAFDADTIFIVVNKAPVANFSITKTDYCLNEGIPFKNLTTSGDTTIRSFTWDFGDGHTSNAKGDFTEFYAKEGTFNVVLTVKDNNGCVSTITKTNFITINPTPKADFTYSQKYACAGPINVNFVNKSTKNPSLQWDFGNSNTSVLPNPTTAYGVEKRYTVTLTAITVNGCKDVKTSSINIKFGNIKANFSTISLLGCIPFDPVLTNTSKPDSVQLDYAWNFGDNSFSIAENPSKSFNKIGTYNIKLKVSGIGCSDSITKTIRVSDRPKSNLKVSDTLGCYGGLTANFSAISKFGKTWTWFVDGKNIVTNTGTMSHVFEDTGFYKVFVQVDDSAGCTETFLFPRIVVQDLEANFEFPDTNSCAPYTFAVSNTTYSALNGFITYTWKLHDGKMSNLKTPTLTYKDTGKFLLKMMVKDKFGCVDSTNKWVTTGMRIKPDFVFNKTKLCMKEKLKLTNTTPKALKKVVNEWSWQIGSNGVQFPDSVTITLTEKPGLITMLLTANHNGCKTTTTKDSSLTLLGAYAEFDYSFDTCYSNNVRMSNQSDSFTSIKWVMPDRTTRSETSFTFKADPMNDMSIKLIAYNTRTKCTDSISKAFGVPRSVADIHAEMKPACTPQEVLFFNRAIGASRLHWDFGNGDTSNLGIGIKDTLSYIYTFPGIFKAVLKGWDNRGCFYESANTLTVKGPTAISKVWPLKGCLPLTINLQDSNSKALLKKKFWLVNNDTVKLSKKGPVTQYVIKQLPFGDSLVKVTFVTQDSNGCTSSKNYYVRPYGPKAAINISSKVNCDAMKFFIEAEIDSFATALPVSISWKMGDGISYNNAKIEHIYSKEGYFKPKLYLVDAYGCNFEKELLVYATKPTLVARFGIVNNRIKCPPLLAEFKDSSIQNEFPIVEYKWNLGEGYVSYEQFPAKLYTMPGNFDISLTIKNSNGCTNTYLLPEGVKVGGPVATYSITNTKGCAPLFVEYKLSGKSLAAAEWDFGNGVTSQINNITYRYTDSGTYFPKILLKDSFDCQSIVLPKDSILVYLRPKALFNISTLCKDDKVDFINQSLSNLNNPAYTSNWLVNKHISVLQDYSEKFNTIGSYTARLIIRNVRGCLDTLQRAFEIDKPKALFTNLKYTYCLGDSLLVMNTSSSKTGGMQMNWYSNKKLISLQNQLNYYPPIGNSLLTLIVFDKNNCSDTFFDNNKVHVADTMPPGLIELENASVFYPDIKVNFKASTDADFNRYTLYHFENGLWQNVAEDKIPGTTFFNFNLRNYVPQSHCFKITQTNFCGAESELISSAPHCTVHITAQPGVNRNMINWNQYIGWPVNNYLLLRQNSKKQWLNDTLATLDGSSFNYIDSTIECTINHSYQIVAVGNTNTRESNSDTAKAHAIWVNTIPAPDLISASVKDNKSVLVKWQLSPNYKRSNFQDVLIYSGKDKEIKSRASNMAIEFTNVDVLNASYTYFMRVTDDCSDTSKLSNIGKTILLKQMPMEQYDVPKFNWTAYREWTAGIQYYEVQRLVSPNIYETVLTTTDTFFTDIYSPVNGVKQYRYRVMAVKKVINSSDYHAESISNEILIIPNSVIYIPNAFSPDKNGINETFNPQGLFVYDYLLEIYNQWGEKVFSTNNCMEGWDGYYKGELCPQGVYYYKIDAKGNDYKKHILNGTVTLLR